MTRKRPGHDDRRRWAATGGWSGVITDGDLRRLHLRGGSFDALRAGEVATRDPKTIGADDLAAKALEIMETARSRASSWSTRASGPSGVIHMHDILRAKIDLARSRFCFSFAPKWP